MSIPAITALAGILIGAVGSHYIQPSWNIGWYYLYQTQYAKYAHQNLLENPNVREKAEAMGWHVSEWSEQEWVEYYDYLLSRVSWEIRR